MRGYTLTAVFREKANKVLFYQRRRDPYKGLFNFVGGKIEAGEDAMASAYRKHKEETSITKEDPW